jgi:HPt (histidine-containing phosphotransfer) domain-containing protein
MDEPPCPMNVALALDRVDGDRAFLGEMVAMFLEESPGLMVQIRDAIAGGNAASLAAGAHNLKNWAGNLEAEATFAALTKLEALGRAGQMEAAGVAYRALERELERLEGELTRWDSEPIPS